VHKLIKSNVSKVILKNLTGEVNLRIVDELTGELRPKTFSEIRKSMRDKFGDSIDYRVRRIVDTELKESEEQAKLVQHKTLGYTHKKWNTQQDANVRTSHQLVHGTVIEIDKKFHLPAVSGGKGKSKSRPGKAMYPGAPDLPPEQRINERCYLTYTKR
jgi:hypothetical protein